MRENRLKKDITIDIADLREKSVIKNLYNLYLHDLSQFTDDNDIDENGVFIWDSEELYWEKNSLYPLIVKYKDKVIGFLLLSEPPYVKEGCDYCIQEFFILRKYREKGLGREVINILFKKYKGRYSLLVLENNKKALKFWRNTYKQNNLKYEEDIMNLDENVCYYHTFKIE
ncbi:MAG: GNAT family N-acetyltransferase [Firmicutes bacterium]|nr:GNAT family N-acetyltransferase [Bacillota bacterium]